MEGKLKFHSLLEKLTVKELEYYELLRSDNKNPRFWQ